MGLKKKFGEDAAKSGNRGALAIQATSCGEWLPAEELRDVATKVVESGGVATVDLSGVDHLEASIAQILLAFAGEQKKHGLEVRLVNASAALGKWFDYSGMAQHFSFE